MILVFIYQFVIQTETYFSLNKDVSRVPAKRIYGISAGMLGVFLLCFVLAAVPAAIASYYRPYTDIRNWFAGEELVTGDWFMDYGELQFGQSDEIPDWMLAAQEDSPEADPDRMNAVFQGIVILNLCGIAVARMQDRSGRYFTISGEAMMRMATE